MNVALTPDLPAGISTRNILGTAVSVLGQQDCIHYLDACLAGKVFTRVGFLNAHIANVASTDTRLRAIMPDFVVLADGVGVDLASRLLYGDKFPANLNGTDFIPAFLAAIKRPLHIGLIGATPENAAKARQAFSAAAPWHRFETISDGYFSESAIPAILGTLEELHPDIVLVAMGVPRQEFFIADQLSPRHCTMSFAVGALFDFMSGAVPRAPLFMRQLRLEWLYRLWLEPGRLWRRYIVGNPAFIVRVLGQKLRQPGMR